jgi:hypothetical protein
MVQFSVLLADAQTTDEEKTETLVARSAMQLSLLALAIVAAEGADSRHIVRECEERRTKLRHHLFLEYRVNLDQQVGKTPPDRDALELVLKNATGINADATTMRSAVSCEPCPEDQSYIDRWNQPPAASQNTLPPAADHISSVDLLLVKYGAALGNTRPLADAVRQDLLARGYQIHVLDAFAKEVRAAGPQPSWDEWMTMRRDPCLPDRMDFSAWQPPPPTRVNPMKWLQLLPTSTWLERGLTRAHLLRWGVQDTDADKFVRGDYW